jgi:hypothetical protein
VTEDVEGLLLKHTNQGEFRYSLYNQKVENYPVIEFLDEFSKTKAQGNFP